MVINNKHESLLVAIDRGNERKLKKINNKPFKILYATSAGDPAGWLRKPLEIHYTEGTG